MRRAIAVLVLAAFASPALAAGVGTVNDTGARVTITDIVTGDTKWFSLNGLYSVSCWSPGGNWDSANIDVETIEPVTAQTNLEGSITDVGVTALVDMTADVTWTGLEAGGGEYRLEIETAGASADIVCVFRRVRD